MTTGAIPTIDTLPQPHWKNIRLVATDMDGTLTRQGKFTSAVLQALEDLTQAGIEVLIITGRSAGWVSGLLAYLPVRGAIAENGGLFYPAPDREPEILVPLLDLARYRQKLGQTFIQLQTECPHIQESTDNRFRITDWTFATQGLTPTDLKTLGDRCREAGWGFTYSTVQCHIKSPTQDKAAGLLRVLQQHFPGYALDQVLTVGDSPNDVTLFNPDHFPLSVGVANVLHYQDALSHQPAFVTHAAEGEGFCELSQILIKAQANSQL